MIQVGRWRREVTIDNVPACADTPVVADMTRLPRNQSEGHLPKIALTTGGADALECLLRKIGISDSEFTPRIGQRAASTSSRASMARTSSTRRWAARASRRSAPWWDDVNNLRKYDMVLHSCEGTENPNNKSSRRARR